MSRGGWNKGLSSELQPMYGKKHSEETKRKIRESLKGRVFTEETRQKMRESARNRPPISEETRKKLSVISKARGGPVIRFQNGHLPWTTGLTKETDERVAKLARSIKKTYEEGRKGWNEGLTKDTDPRLRRISESKKKNWASLSPEKRIEYHKSHLGKASRHPNKPERKLIEYLEPLGFQYNRTPIVGDYNIHIPDFIHNTLNLIIEFDGFGGHNSKSMFTSNNQVEIDEKDHLRDETYKEAGYRILRILPEHLEKGKGFIQEMVKEWM